MFTRPQETFPFDKSLNLSKDGKNLRSIKIEGVNEEFQFNAFGFPLNDIAALNGAKSVQEYNAIVSRLNQYIADNPETKDMSVKDIINTIYPRSFQTPSELERASQWISSRYQDEIDMAYERAKMKVVQAKEVPSEPSTVTTT